MPKFIGYHDLYENIAAAVRLQRLGDDIDHYVFDENPAELTYDQRAMISRKISDIVAEAIQIDARELSHFASAAVRYFEQNRAEVNDDDEA